MLLSAFILKFVSGYWSLALKLASLAITGILGVIALLNNFKDKNGKLNKWGWISFLGLVLAAAVGVATEIVDSHQQREEAKEQARQAQEQANAARNQTRNTLRQLELADSTQTQVQNVLEENKKIQSDTRATLAQQSRLLGASQATLHEVDRGLTPLGKISVDYQLSVPIGDPDFDKFRTLINTAVEKVAAEHKDTPPPRGRRAGGSAHLEARKGLTIQGSSVYLAPDSDIFYESAGWELGLFRHSPFVLKLWQEQPSISPTCRASTVPDLILVPAKKEGEHPYEISTEISNSYSLQKPEINQSGTISMLPEMDDGMVTSALDLEGVTLGVTPEDENNSRFFPEGFTFSHFVLYAGHFIVRLDHQQPFQHCGASLYFRLPDQLPLLHR